MPKRRRSIRDAFKEANPEFALHLIKKFRHDEPQNSDQSVKTHESHIIYFQPFLNYPVKLDDYIKVEPTYWARAFLEMETYAITCLLCGLLYSQKHLGNRHELSVIRKTAIRKAVKFLVCKTQDPWNYDYKTASMPTMQNDANLIHEMDRAFDTFTTFYINIFDVSEIDLFANDGADEPKEEISSTSSADTVSEMLEKMKDNSSVVPHDEEDLFDMINYDDHFKKVLKDEEEGKSTVSLGNPAQTAAHMTKIAIHQNTDIFVDAVQFSKFRWAQSIEAALYNKSLFEIMEPIFRKYWRQDFERKKIPFRSFRDVCPVKRLALIRATAWIRMNHHLGYEFDSSIPEQNLFLTAEEIRDIEKAFTEKYRKTNDYIKDFQLEDQEEILQETASCFQELASAYHEIVSGPSSTLTSGVAHFSGNSHFRSISESSGHSSTNDVFAMSSVTSSSSPVVQLMESLISVTFLANNAGVNLEQNGIGYVIPGEAWTKAKQTFESTKSNSHEKAGKKAAEKLFDDMFDKKEIVDCTYNGRNNTTPLCHQKLTAILNAVALMRFLGTPGSIQSPHTFQIAPLVQWEKDNIIVKVFKEYRSRRKTAIRKNNSGSAANK